MADTVKRVYPDAGSVRIYFALVLQGAAVAVRYRVVPLSCAYEHPVRTGARGLTPAVEELVYGIGTRHIGVVGAKADVICPPLEQLRHGFPPQSFPGSGHAFEATLAQARSERGRNQGWRTSSSGHLC